MIELTPFLKKLLTVPGLSGYESAAHEVIAEAWKPLVDELSTSRLNSLHGFKRGSGAAPRPRLLLAAHADAIGLMVTGITGDLLRVTQIGGLDDRILPAQLVTVHGRRALPGVIVQPPDRLLPPNLAGNPVKQEYLFVDVGLTAAELKEVVRVGDLISFAQQPLELAGDALAGHSLDDRAAVAALTVCLDELRHMTHAWDVWAVATAQEEVTMAGALTSGYEIRPALAIAVDVTFAKGPGANDHRTFGLGKGPTLGWGPNIHPALHRAFKDLAEKLDIPHQVEVMPHHSGTDAFGLQVVAEGIPTMVIGIPLRYMHTPVEEVALKDISRAGHLLAEFISRLEPDFIAKITWDDKPAQDNNKGNAK